MLADLLHASFVIIWQSVPTKNPCQSKVLPGNIVTTCHARMLTHAVLMALYCDAALDTWLEALLDTGTSGTVSGAGTTLVTVSETALCRQVCLNFHT